MNRPVILRQLLFNFRALTALRGPRFNFRALLVLPPVLRAILPASGSLPSSSLTCSLLRGGTGVSSTLQRQ